MSQLLLMIGNRNYSSWSLRAWLAMKNANLAFDEEMIPLDLENTKERLRESSPAARVPVLRVQDDGTPDALVVWDTLAIIEYLAEQYPGSALVARRAPSALRCTVALPACADKFR